MLRLAAPVVIAQLSQMSMGLVDTLMLGRLGSQALGAAGIGGVVYFFWMVFSFGVVAAVGPVVAQAHGAGNREEIGRAVGQGLWIATGLTVIGILISWNAAAILTRFGQDPEVAALAESYTRAMSFGLAANLWYSVFRALADGLGHTRIAMAISVPAVFINGLADWLLIYGSLGFPALGVAGAGWATAIVRWAMLGMMLLYLSRNAEYRQYGIRANARRPKWETISSLIRLGLPMGMGHSMEHGFFGATSLLMGTIGTITLAAHQVAINAAAITFMVPMGLSIAISTRVGHAVGRGDPPAAALAGWIGVGQAAFFMCCTATMFIIFSEEIVSLYTDDRAIIDHASGLLKIAGAFQVVDGLQVAALGALRGLKDTRVPMITNLISYWVIGLPAGWLLAFVLGGHGDGLWWGLTIGLAVAALLHNLRFRKLVMNITGTKA